MAAGIVARAFFPPNVDISTTRIEAPRCPFVTTAVPSGSSVAYWRELVALQLDGRLQVTFPHDVSPVERAAPFVISFFSNKKTSGPVRVVRAGQPLTVLLVMVTFRTLRNLANGATPQELNDGLKNIHELVKAIKDKQVTLKLEPSNPIPATVPAICHPDMAYAVARSLVVITTGNAIQQLHAVRTLLATLAAFPHQSAPFLNESRSLDSIQKAIKQLPEVATVSHLATAEGLLTAVPKLLAAAADNGERPNATMMHAAQDVFVALQKQSCVPASVLARMKSQSMNLEVEYNVRPTNPATGQMLPGLFAILDEPWASLLAP